MKNKIKKYIYYHLFKSIPFGLDPFKDISTNYPKIKIEVIFDVGANIGQSAINFSKLFPKSQIYCFEPNQTSYINLKNNCSKFKNTLCYNFAISDEIGLLKISNKKNHLMNNIIDDEKKEKELNFNLVKAKSLDDFSIEQKIDKIDYLKIDVEGYELKVLYSCSELLNKKKINFINLEVGINSFNNYHTSLNDVQKILENKGYILFGIYDQVLDWVNKRKVLRRVNAVFVNEEISKY